MTIYIVTQGSYSDYHIQAVFTDEALADAYVADSIAADPGSYDKPGVEEYETDLDADALRARIPTWHVVMRWGGDVIRCQRNAPVITQINWSPFNGTWTAFVKADDAERAIKIVNERRLIAIADGTQRELEKLTEYVRRSYPEASQ